MPNAEKVVEKVVGSFAVDGLHLCNEHKDRLYRVASGQLSTEDAIKELNLKYAIAKPTKEIVFNG
ncbi:MAG: antitoxin VbhA family protein [Defluviitaleaceae bacterium]|nr:antitoxin VbhA family protein [Defluviitaleaceae bacterium]